MTDPLVHFAGLPERHQPRTPVYGAPPREPLRLRDVPAAATDGLRAEYIHGIGWFLSIPGPVSAETAAALATLWPRMTESSDTGGPATQAQAEKIIALLADMNALLRAAFGRAGR